MRGLVVIEKFVSEGKKVIILCGKKQLDFVRIYLAKKSLFDNYTLIETNTDFGLLVKEDSLVLDKEQIITGVSEHISNFPALIEFSKTIIQKHHVTHVISDITPWILTAAKEMHIKSTLMVSFTWLDIYEEFLPQKLLRPFIDCYADAQQVLFYDLANPRTVKRFPQGIHVGLSARKISAQRVREIKASYSNGNPVVFMSVGASNSGIKSSYDVSNLPYNFILTNGISLTGSNVTHLPLNVLDTQNYIAASDYCISKAGWTSLAEMLLAQKPMALLRRDDDAEDRFLIQELSRRKQAIPIDLFDLAGLEKILTKMEHFNWSTPHYSNDYQKIANLILDD